MIVNYLTIIGLMVKRNDRTNLDFTQPGYFNLTIYPVNLGGTD